MLDGVLEQGVEGDAQRLGVGEQRPGLEATEPPRARDDLGPAQEDVLEERLDVDLGRHDEVRLVRLGQQQQPLQDVLDPTELVERDLDFLAAGAVHSLQQLEMTARDRHGRTQLVRDVVEEPLLLGEQLGALGRFVLKLPDRVLAPARMPDHRQEHRRHQRYLEQLAPELLAVEGVAQDQRARRRNHEAEHDAGGARRPDPEAVDQGQADPDEVERDRLPARDEPHRDQVRHGEGEPRELDAVTPD